MKRRSIAIAGGLLLFALFSLRADATQLSYVSDTISDSRPSYPANHAIIFSVPDAVPPSGSIKIGFENGLFPIPLGFGYSDMDLAVSTSSPTSGFVERTLAASADAANDGVGLAPYTGPIVITLSSGSGIPAGSYVRILIGTNAPNGSLQIANPSSTASYHIYLNTYDASGTAIDYGSAMVAILPAVGVSANTNRKNPPVLSNGMPTGTIPSNISAVEVTFNTDEYAICRYATTSGVLYENMTNGVSNDQYGFFHYFTVNGGFAQGNTYSYYVRCVDFANNTDTADYAISFSAGEPTGVAPGGGSYPASPGGGGGGGAYYPPLPTSPSIAISGTTFPSATVHIMQDGTVLPEYSYADNYGNFAINILSVSQGVYTYTAYVNDPNGNRLSSYTFTITVIAGTTNKVSGFLMSPSVSLSTDTVPVGGTLTISGTSVPSSTVKISVVSQSGAQSPVTATASADPSGAWSYVLDTTGYAVDTYEITALATIQGFTKSDPSGVAYLGIGQGPVPATGNPDLDGDGKVDLVDFSIMLAHWGQAYAPADLNHDGTVDLPDLSILLSHWTG